MQQQKSQLVNAENSGIQWTIQYLCTKHNIQEHELINRMQVTRARGITKQAYACNNKGHSHAEYILCT